MPLGSDLGAPRELNGLRYARGYALTAKVATWA
jgi:hypothetical protein